MTGKNKSYKEMDSHKERAREIARKYYQKNKVEILKKRKIWYEKNSDIISKKYTKKNGPFKLDLDHKTPDSVLMKQGEQKSKKNAPVFREYIREIIKEVENGRGLDSDEL